MFDNALQNGFDIKAGNKIQPQAKLNIKTTIFNTRDDTSSGIANQISPTIKVKIKPTYKANKYNNQNAEPNCQNPIGNNISNKIET